MCMAKVIRYRPLFGAAPPWPSLSRATLSVPMARERGEVGSPAGSLGR